MTHGPCRGWYSLRWSDDQCRVCWLAKTEATKVLGPSSTQCLCRPAPKSLGAPVSRVTSASIPLPTVVSVAPCVHLGEPVPHQSCGCKEKVRECALFGTCTTGVRRAGIRCCEGCDGFASSDHYDTSRRHLLYYVFPVQGSNWKWNCDQVKGSLDLFNGRRVVAVGTSSNKFTLDSVQEVVDYLGPSFDVIEVPQRKRLGEVLAFPDLLKRVKNFVGPEDFTLYCHAKGTTRPPGMTTTWTDLMYRACFNWEWVEESIRGLPLTGPFKMPWRADPALWFYSGTFFWMRNKELFSIPNVLRVPQFYGGVEHWPSHIIPYDRAGCCFYECTQPTSLYDARITNRAERAMNAGHPRTKTDLLDSFAEAVPKVRACTAPEVSGEGIVTLTDANYFPSTWVQVHRLRALGCTLPVICYTNDLSLLPLPGVTYRRLPDVDIPIPFWRWAIKPWLILDSGFRHCLYLDADVYPIKDPTELLGRTTLWGEAEPGASHWRPKVFGLHDTGSIAPQGGTQVWDVWDGYQVLELWKHLNRDSDYWFPLTYSDQETLQAAIDKLGYQCLRHPRVTMVKEVGVYLHGDYFIHRIVPKFTATTDPISCPTLIDNCLVMEEYHRWKTISTASR